MHEPSAPIPAPLTIPAPRPTGSGAVDQAVAVWSALAELGLAEAVLAPGSRSAPLVYGLAADEVAGGSVPTSGSTSAPPPSPPWVSAAWIPPGPPRS